MRAVCGFTVMRAVCGRPLHSDMGHATTAGSIQAHHAMH